MSRSRPEVTVVHRRVMPARPGVAVGLPQDLPSSVAARLTQAGFAQLWQHQARALRALRDGQSVVLATGTGSGKSLVYQLAAAWSADEDARRTTLHLSPTKALGHDQARSGAWTGLRIGVLDGDTPAAEREWIASHGQYVITNPDLLCSSMLPRHRRWLRILANLQLIVVDECHVYRGVFGSHVALTLRRLLRLASHLGARPLIAAASATVSEPSSVVERLTGVQPTSITDDGSPRGAVSIAIHSGGTNPGSEAADLVTSAVERGEQVLAFVPSRAGVERLAIRLRETLPAHAAAGVRAYRAGLLPEERRQIEGELHERSLQAVASTNALELGMDISGLDRVVIAGWPSRAAAFWQQAGRAGRAGAEGSVDLLMAQDPLDQYLAEHPEEFLDQPAEAGIIDPSNEHLLRRHLLAAAAERPVDGDDLELFGPRTQATLDALVDERLLRLRPNGYYWAHARPPEPISDIRSIGAGPVQIVEADTGRLLGTVEAAAAPTSVFTGAVYVHQGHWFEVAHWDRDSSVALVRATHDGVTTTALSDTQVDIIDTQEERGAGVGTVRTGTVIVTRHVHGYMRRDAQTGQVLSSHALDLPPTAMRTQGCWWTWPEDCVHGLDPALLAGSAHAAEHAAIGLLPAVVTCDRWDVGGVSTVCHPTTGALTVIVYDGTPGGMGYSRRAFDRLDTWLRATRTAIATCPCDEGCPRCIISPKCGSGNEPLHKQGAVRLLGLLGG